MHSDRLQRLSRNLARHKLDFFLVTHLPNLRYLTGFTGSAGVLAVDATGGDVFITDGRYKEQAREQVRGARVMIAKKAAMVAAGEWLRSRVSGRGKTSSVGIETAHLTVAD